MKIYFGDVYNKDTISSDVTKYHFFLVTPVSIITAE